MPTGTTSTGALTDSLQLIVDSATSLREFPGVMVKLVERHTLSQGTGLSWEEVELAQLTAQAVTESTIMDNPQQIVDSLRTITPTISGISTRITERAKRRITPMVASMLGKLAGEAMERKKDEDGITTMDGFGTSIPGANNTLDDGHIAAAARRIRGNSTAPSYKPIRTVLHPYQIHDIQSVAVGGVGTYPTPQGMSEDVFKNGWMGNLYGTAVYEDGNIPIDVNDDSKGGVFSEEAIVMIQGASLDTKKKDRPEIGGGAEDLFIYDEYAFGERTPGGTSTWGFEIMSDATAPTA